jgi:hypothetical protein
MADDQGRSRTQKSQRYPCGTGVYRNLAGRRWTIKTFSRFANGAPRPMKMGTIASLSCYDAVADQAIRPVNLRRTAILRYASWAAVSRFLRWSGYPSIPALSMLARAQQVLYQFIEQGLGLLQVQRFKAFGEPAVDRIEKVSGFIPLPSIAPRWTSASYHFSFVVSTAVIASLMKTGLARPRRWHRSGCDRS